MSARSTEDRLHFTSRVGTLLISTAQLPYPPLKEIKKMAKLGVLPDYSYETIIFPCNEQGMVTDWSGVFCERYKDRSIAVARHRALVALLKSGMTVERIEREGL